MVLIGAPRNTIISPSRIAEFAGNGACLDFKGAFCLPCTLVKSKFIEDLSVECALDWHVRS